jgi:hypothetical protein
MPLHAESVGTPATGRRKGGKSAQRVYDRMLNCQTYFGHRQHRPTRLPLPLPSASQRAPSSQKGRLAPVTAVRYDLHSHARRRSHPCAPPSYVHAVDPLASAVANRSRRGGKDGYITTRTASLCGVRVCNAARARRRRGSHPTPPTRRSSPTRTPYAARALASDFSFFSAALPGLALALSAWLIFFFCARDTPHASHASFLNPRLAGVCAVGDGGPRYGVRSHLGVGRLVSRLLGRRHAERRAGREGT